VQAGQNLWKCAFGQQDTNYKALSERKLIQNKIPAQNWAPFWPHA
jgi:hypothetical protein